MEIGAARTLYTIYGPGTLTPNGQGGQVDSGPVVVGTLWGEEVDLTGRDLMAASRISTRAGIKIRARWWPGLTTRHYLKDGTRKLLIHSVQNVGNRNAELRLLCEEVQQ